MDTSPHQMDTSPLSSAPAPLVTPAPLRPGDRIAMVSPATKVRREYVEDAARFFRDAGYEPVVMPHAIGEPSGSFAASLADRLADLTAALADPGVRVIFCNRGGYGVQQLLPLLDPALVAADPKWIVGFSDISALHALWTRAGVKSLHSPMAKHISTCGADSATREMMRILAGGAPCEIRVKGDVRNIPGEVTGRLGGGNMAVLNGLAATPLDMLGGTLTPDILFIEDIGENIYEIDRMITRMAMAGAFRKIKGLIVGEFTDYVDDLNYPSMEDMLAARLAALGVDCPVAFGFPVGHGERNRPMVEGAMATLSVSAEETRLIAL